MFTGTWGPEKKRKRKEADTAAWARVCVADAELGAIHSKEIK